LWTEAIAPQLLPLGALGVYSWIVAQQPWSRDGWPALIGVTVGGGVVLGAAWFASQQLAGRVALRREALR
jgi:hypothetical protein